MPEVTHSVVDTVGGQPLGVRSVTVKLLGAAAAFRTSDGAQVAATEQVEFPVSGGGPGHSNSYSLTLRGNADLTPSGTRYQLTQHLDDGRKSVVVVVVPPGPGPYRVADILAPPDSGPPLFVNLVARGTYNASASYNTGDVVAYQGKSYLARSSHTGHTPPAAVDDYWQVLGAVEASDGTAPAATTATRGIARLAGGTADDPTVPWDSVTGHPDIDALADEIDQRSRVLVDGQFVTEASFDTALPTPADIGAAPRLIFRSRTRTAGNLSITSQSVAPVDSTGAFDLTIPAAVGDLVEITLHASGGNENTSMDFAVSVLDAANSEIRKLPASGLMTPWTLRPNDYFAIGAPIAVPVQTGDVPDGMLRLRLLAQVGNPIARTLRASTIVPLTWYAKNFGAAAL